MHSSLVLTDPAQPHGSTDVVLRATPLTAGGRNEAWLRDFLLNHPAALPASAIDPAYADLVPVCRELRTRAGPLDCLFVTRFGGLVVVECKLWRNPQARREVVGQILDYAKELASWTYTDLQRQISVARREPGVDALYRLVAARYPDVLEAHFIDAVERNLKRGRLLLLLAGDGIREGTEAIVQYVGRYAGLNLTFGLVEMATYDMPDGRLLVQPRLLARTTNIERAIVRVEGPGAGQARILSVEDLPLETVDEDTFVQDRLEPTPKREFDPIVKESDRRWRSNFVRYARFDDPAQGVGSSGFGRVYLPLPVSWAWITAYSSGSQNRVGNFLTLRDEAGRVIFVLLIEERNVLETELTAAVPNAKLDWMVGAEVCRVSLSRTFAGEWSPDQEAEQLDWLLTTSNAFINAIRPRIVRLLTPS